MKHALFLFLLIGAVACNNSSKTEEPVLTDSVVSKTQKDAAANYIHTFTDTVLENRITAALLKLPFVQKSNNYIDSLSDHKHGIAFLLDKPEANEPDVSVQAGYNGDERFETYYRFFVNPKTLEIKVYDAAADKKLSLKEYLKTLK